MLNFVLSAIQTQSREINPVSSHEPRSTVTDEWNPGMNPGWSTLFRVSPVQRSIRESSSIILVYPLCLRDLSTSLHPPFRSAAISTIAVRLYQYSPPHHWRNSFDVTCGVSTAHATPASPTTRTTSFASLPLAGVLRLFSLRSYLHIDICQQCLHQKILMINGNCLP